MAKTKRLPTALQVRRRLRRIMRRDELTQGQLADLFHYGRAGMNHILNGKRTPRPFLAFVRRLEQIEGRR